MAKIDSNQSFFSSLFSTVTGDGATGDPTADGSSSPSYLFGSSDAGSMEWMNLDASTTKFSVGDSSGTTGTTGGSFDPLALSKLATDDSTGDSGGSDEGSPNIIGDLMDMAKDKFGISSFGSADDAAPDDAAADDSSATA